MNLTKNLTLAEVTKSNTATRLGIENIPNGGELNNLINIAEKIFQPLRDYFDVPIGISSGFRNQNLNRACGGSLASQHGKGQALDLDGDIFGGCDNIKIFRFIQHNLDFDQLIWEFGTELNPSWVHVSYVSKEKNRGQILKAFKLRGKTAYTTWG